MNNPFEKQNLPTAANVGAVAIEQERAIAEAQGQLILAKRFPRDEFAAHENLMKSCSLHSLASIAFYSVPRAGGTVSGPSIRLAEEIARVYGNFEYGHKELSRDDKKSEVVVYAWDKENNNYSSRQITVFHIIDTKQGPKPCRDQKDIDDKIANVASKQMRGRILALLPKWMVEEAIQKCRETLKGNSFEPLENQVRRLMQSFAVYGVTTHMVKEHLNHDVSEITSDEFADLVGVYNSIAEGGMKPSDVFSQAQADAEPKEKQKPKTLKADLQQKQEAKQAAPANAMPDFDDEPADTGAPTVVDLMLDDLGNCETGEDFKQWLTNAKKQFPDKSLAEYQTLAAKYNETVAAKSNK